MRTICTNGPQAVGNESVGLKTWVSVQHMYTYTAMCIYIHTHICIIHMYIYNVCVYVRVYISWLKRIGGWRNGVQVSLGEFLYSSIFLYKYFITIFLWSSLLLVLTWYFKITHFKCIFYFLKSTNIYGGKEIIMLKCIKMCLYFLVMMICSECWNNDVH